MLLTFAFYIPILGIGIIEIMINPFKMQTVKRLKKAKGQLEGLIRMVETDQYCPKILIQLLALQGAIKKIAPLILESHLHTCGAEHLASPDHTKKEKFIRELVKVCELSGR